MAGVQWVQEMRGAEVQWVQGCEGLQRMQGVQRCKGYQGFKVCKGSSNAHLMMLSVTFHPSR